MRCALWILAPALIMACSTAAQQQETPREESETEVTAETESTVTIRIILDSDGLVGRSVTLKGFCRGYGSLIGTGPPPLTRSDWLFADNGDAIWVSGRLPKGCSATEGSDQETTIDAVVRQDTLPAMGDNPARPRRYLVRLVDQ